MSLTLVAKIKIHILQVSHLQFAPYGTESDLYFSQRAIHARNPHSSDCHFCEKITSVHLRQWVDSARSHATIGWERDFYTRTHSHFRPAFSADRSDRRSS